MSDYELSLVVEAKKGKKKAFDRLYDSFHKKVNDVVYSELGDRSRADTIQRAVFEKLKVQIKNLDNPAGFENLVLGLTAAECKNYPKAEHPVENSGSSQFETYESSAKKEEDIPPQITLGGFVTSVPDNTPREDYTFVTKHENDGSEAKTTFVSDAQSLNDLPPHDAKNIPPQGANGFPPQGDRNMPPQGANGFPPQGDRNMPPQGANGFPQQGDRNMPPQGANGFPPQGDRNMPPQGANGFPPQGAQNMPPQGANGFPPQGTQNTPPQGANGFPPQGTQNMPPQGGQRLTPPAAPQKEPIVAWLVCVNGADRGRDYPIRDKINIIGSSPNNDIQVNGEPAVAPENHACIAYDSESTACLLLAGAMGAVCLNGEFNDYPQPLNKFDIITIGNAQFVFAPASEGLGWKHRFGL